VRLPLRDTKKWHERLNFTAFYGPLEDKASAGEAHKGAGSGGRTELHRCQIPFKRKLLVASYTALPAQAWR